MANTSTPSIVIVMQNVEGNAPGMRLIRVCSEFGEVKVVTHQKGDSNSSGLKFERLVLDQWSGYRAAAALMRRLTALLPSRMRRNVWEGYMAVRFGLAHQGQVFRRLWKRLNLKPSLLVMQGAEFMTTAGRLARSAGCPTVYHVHEMFPNQEEAYTRPLVAHLRTLECRECHAAAHILVQHHLWGKLLRRRYRLPAGKFTEVTPSPPPQDTLPGSEPDQPLRLYYHGYLAANRGLTVLVKGVGLVPGVQFDLRGTGAYEAHLKALVAEAGAEDRIRFLPPIPTAELAASGRSYDLGVVTGKSEHLNGRMSAGIKLYENMAAGIGLFGYRAVTMRHMVRKLGIGFTYSADSPEDVAKTLRYCLAHRDEVKAARENAAAAARAYYNETTQTQRLRALIGAVIQSGSGNQSAAPALLSA